MYTAVSVIDALKNSAKLACEGEDLIMCPRRDLGDCLQDPAGCSKGQMQECKQQVKVYSDYQRLGILTFYFMVSPTDYNGFIRKQDSVLNNLLRRNLIDSAKLKPAG
ncbi:hypothetical protein AGMMS50268_31670 [Spirochaetia bacterium]|nr:hypothetical protein AGMMS50268_31670 [Spirochaetia bacterium]